MAGLAERLMALGYAGLFLRLDPPADALWQEPGMASALRALAGDAAAPGEARFLAAEMVLGYAPGTLAVAPETLAEAYAAAMRGTRMANMWGLPGALDAPPARNLLALGQAAIPALRPLLDDARRVIYGGSEDATIGNAAGWRVKDLAASAIATIRGEAFDAAAPPAMRDAAIAAFTR